MLRLIGRPRFCRRGRTAGGVVTPSAAALQDEGGGEPHHAQSHARQHRHDDELHAREPGTATLLYRDLHFPVVMVTNVPGPGGPDGPAGVRWSGQRLAGGSCESRRAEAAEAPDSVEAAAAVQAGPTGAVVQVDGAEPPREPNWAETGEPVHSIHTGGATGTRPHRAVVRVGLTARARESGQAAAR